MELKFNLRPYQVEAITSVVDLFIGADLYHNKFDRSKTTKEINKNSNFLSINKKDILNNLQQIQKDNNRPEAPIEITKDLKDLDFTIEMEAGTGKTFVYFKTIMEVKKNYGWRKFVIVVPSVAIREGVLSEFKRIKAILEHEYKEPVFAYIYDSKRLSEIESDNCRSFVESMILHMK